jgi:hypothetical protein
MQINPRTTGYLLGLNAVVLVFGYSLRAPNLQQKAQQQSSIRDEQQAAAYERREAMNRAQRCVVLATELPITDGTAAYYSSTKQGRQVVNTKRPLPAGTTVCDQFGNTGIVATNLSGKPVVSDIAQLPPEEMEQILVERGVLLGKSRFRGKKNG